MGRPDEMAECLDCAAHRPKTRGTRVYERSEQIVVEVGLATSRPQPVRSPGLDNPRPGCGNATSHGPPASHR